jgi:hypothetical protein
MTGPTAIAAAGGLEMAAAPDGIQLVATPAGLQLIAAPDGHEMVAVPAGLAADEETAISRSPAGWWPSADATGNAWLRDVTESILEKGVEQHRKAGRGGHQLTGRRHGSRAESVRLEKEGIKVKT